MRKLPATPPNHRLYVIGDIHGRFDLLSKLLDLIDINAAKHPNRKKKIVFLGDYIDRGLESRAVLERMTQPFGNDLLPTFLRGNHEEKLLSILEGDIDGVLTFLKYGGDATFASYGTPFTPTMSEKEIIKTAIKFVEIFPKPHFNFLKQTQFHKEYGDYYFVHAGVRPGKSLEEQKPQDQMWIRQEFIPSKFRFEKMIIHGHTISEKPDVQHNRIGIDTGAYATGQLTCLVLDGTKRMMMQT